LYKAQNKGRKGMKPAQYRGRSKHKCTAIHEICAKCSQIGLD